MVAVAVVGAGCSGGCGCGVRWLASPGSRPPGGCVSAVGWPWLGCGVLPPPRLSSVRCVSALRVRFASGFPRVRGFPGLVPAGCGRQVARWASVVVVVGFLLRALLACRFPLVLSPVRVWAWVRCLRLSSVVRLVFLSHSFIITSLLVFVKGFSSFFWFFFGFFFENDSHFQVGFGVAIAD